MVAILLAQGQFPIRKGGGILRLSLSFLLLSSFRMTRARASFELIGFTSEPSTRIYLLPQFDPREKSWAADDTFFSESAPQGGSQVALTTPATWFPKCTTSCRLAFLERIVNV